MAVVEAAEAAAAVDAEVVTMSKSLDVSCSRPQIDPGMNMPGAC